MNIAELGAIAGTLVAMVYPITESLKTQVKNVKEKKFEQVGYFIVGMGVTVGSAFLLKNSNLIDFEALKSLNVTDTLILGTVAGLTITGGKDLISNIGKGKELGQSLKEQLSNLSADEVANVAFEVMKDKGVVFSDDMDDGVGEIVEGNIESGLNEDGFEPLDENDKDLE